MTYRLITLLLTIILGTAVKSQTRTQQLFELKRLSLENSYTSVGYFDTSTGIATVYHDMKMGYIDTAGNLILPIAYHTRDFSDGLGIYRDYASKIIRVIDKNGKLVRQFKNISSLHEFVNGRSIFSVRTSAGEFYGVMDLNGEWIIQPRYPYLERISSRYYYVNTNKHGSGIINLQGDTVIPFKYVFNYIDTADLHFIGISDSTGWAIFDSSGKIMKQLARNIFTKRTYIDGRHYFSRDGVIIVQDRFKGPGEKYALVNLSFDTIVPLGRFSHLSDSNEGLIRFSDSAYIHRFPNGVSISQFGKSGFINTKGEIIIPAEYDFATYFSEGLSVVRKNGKYGYINKNGELVIPFRYDYARPFRHGYAKVQIGQKFYIIDKQGKRVLKSKTYR